MYLEYIENKRLVHERVITTDFKREIMYIPHCQQHIINDQVQTLIAMDFFIDDKREYIKLLKNRNVNWDLLELVNIPRSYIYKLKRQRIRRY